MFLAWGTPAAKRVAKVDRNRHKVLQSVHPSPLSAHRGFFDCGHFKKANEWLETRYTVDGIIDWNLSSSNSSNSSTKVAPISKAPVAHVAETPSETHHNGNVTSNGDAKKHDIPDDEDEFGDVDDDDAIEALNEVVKEAEVKDQNVLVTANEEVQDASAAAADTDVDATKSEVNGTVAEVDESVAATDGIASLVDQTGKEEQGEK